MRTLERYAIKDVAHKREVSNLEIGSSSVIKVCYTVYVHQSSATVTQTLVNLADLILHGLRLGYDGYYLLSFFFN